MVTYFCSLGIELKVKLFYVRNIQIFETPEKI